MRKSLPFGLLIIFLLLAGVVRCQTIPSTRIPDWSGAGLRLSFPDSLPMINSAYFGVWADGVHDDHAAVQAAIDSLHGRWGIVLLPPGDILLNSMLVMPDSAILRGRGAGVTRLVFDLQGATGQGIRIAGSAFGATYAITLPASRGDSILHLNTVSGITVGAHIDISQENGSWDSNPASWAARSDGQMARVTEVLSGNRIRIDEALSLFVDTALAPTVRQYDPAVAVGIENLTITRKDSLTATSGYNIFISYASDCWIDGVESDHSIQSHFYLVLSSHISVAGCYLHHASAYDGSGTAGYGITLNKHASSCLIENNVFRVLRHAMMVKTGANGNVFGYNYSIEPRRSEPIPDYSADISLHGHHPFANLFEGNQAQNIIIDHYWGPSGPYNTFFRNRAALYGIIITSATVLSDSQNVVGNEVVSAQFLQTLGFLPGPYELNGAGHFEHGNNDRGTVKPPGTASIPEASLYLSGQPAFWSPGLPFPCIGYPNTLWQYNIPAALRYAGSSPAMYTERVPGYLVWPRVKNR